MSCEMSDDSQNRQVHAQKHMQTALLIYRQVYCLVINLHWGCFRNLWPAFVLCSQISCKSSSITRAFAFLGWEWFSKWEGGERGLGRWGWNSPDAGLWAPGECACCEQESLRSKILTLNCGMIEIPASSINKDTYAALLGAKLKPFHGEVGR